MLFESGWMIPPCNPTLKYIPAIDLYLESAHIFKDGSISSACMLLVTILSFTESILFVKIEDMAERRVVPVKNKEHIRQCSNAAIAVAMHGLVNNGDHHSPQVTIR